MVRKMVNSVYASAAAVSLFLGLCLMLPVVAHAQQVASVEIKGEGAGAIGGGVTVSATVEAINHETREVTLKSETGEVLEIIAGDEVRNLDQVKVGDIVDVEYFEALALALQEIPTGIQERSETVDTARADPGEKPAGIVSRRIEVLAKVIEVDKINRLVVLQGPDGVATLKVDDDVDLANIDVYDEVKAVYIEEVAISVRSPE